MSSTACSQWDSCLALALGKSSDRTPAMHVCALVLESQDQLHCAVCAGAANLLLQHVLQLRYSMLTGLLCYCTLQCCHQASS